MSNYNIIIYIVEDDSRMNSSFFQDMDYLLQKNNTIPIHINYRAQYFFVNLYIKITQDELIAKKIKNIKLDHSSIMENMLHFYQQHYLPGHKNILLYGGHSNYLYHIDNIKQNIIHDRSNVNYIADPNLFKKFKDIHLLILDSCYTSVMEILDTLYDTKYMLGCQTPGPNYGFISKKFLHILNSNLDEISKYKKLVDGFIKRNNTERIPYKKFNYRTDGVLIDVFKYNEMKQFCERYCMKYSLSKNRKCRVEDLIGYNYYDVLCLLKEGQTDEKLEELIKSCILYQKMNKLNTIFYNKKNKKLNGLSTTIL